MCFEEFAHCRTCGYTVQQKEFCPDYRLEWVKVLLGQSTKTPKQIGDECGRYGNTILFFPSAKCPRCAWNPPRPDEVVDHWAWAYHQRVGKFPPNKLPKKFNIVEGEICSCGCYQDLRKGNEVGDKEPHYPSHWK